MPGFQGTQGEHYDERQAGRVESRAAGVRLQALGFSSPIKRQKDAACELTRPKPEAVAQAFDSERRPCRILAVVLS